MVSHHPQSLTPMTAMVCGYPAAACLPASTLPPPRSAHEPHLFPNCCSQMCSRPCRTASSASILELEARLRRHQGGSSAPRRSPPSRRACRAALPTTRWAQVRRRWRAAVPMMRAGSGPDAACLWSNARALAGSAMHISRCFAPCQHWQSREGVCLMAYKALPIPWMGPGLTAGLGGPTRTTRDAARCRYRRHAYASVVLACIACVPQHMQRLRADFRTPATRRECRAAVASDAMTTTGTAAAAAGAVVAADDVSPPSAAVHVAAARGPACPVRAVSEAGRDRHEGRFPWPRVSWAINIVAAASVSSRGAFLWASTRPMHVVQSRVGRFGRFAVNMM